MVGVFLELLKDWLLCCHEMFLTWKGIFYGLVEVYSIYFKYFFQECLVVLNSGGHVVEWRSFPCYYLVSFSFYTIIEREGWVFCYLWEKPIFLSAFFRYGGL